MARSAALGQNFLRDEGIARRIVALVPAGDGPLLEIGPGQGILTRLLLGRFPGRPLTVVEVDGGLAERLRQELGERARVLNRDILDVELEALFPGENAAVVGNLPYHISKPLADWLIAQSRRIAAAVVMLQKDFVDKLLAPGGGKKYNAQSAAFQLLFAARRAFDVPAAAFAPKPKVVSTVLAARPRGPAPERFAEFYEFTKRCFAERRKTLWNNLAPHMGNEALAAAFAALELAQNVRAEQLPPRILHGLFLALPAATGA